MSAPDLVEAPPSDADAPVESPPVGGVRHMNTKTVGEIGAEYQVAADRVSALEEQLKAAKEQKERMAYTLIDKMQDQGVDLVRVGHRSYSPKVVTHYGITGDTEKAYATLRALPEWCDLIKPTVNAQTFKKACREAEAGGGIPDQLRPYIRIYSETTLSSVSAGRRGTTD